MSKDFNFLITSKTKLAMIGKVNENCKFNLVNNVNISYFHKPYVYNRYDYCICVLSQETDHQSASRRARSKSLCSLHKYTSMSTLRLLYYQSRIIIPVIALALIWGVRIWINSVEAYSTCAMPKLLGQWKQEIMIVLQACVFW